jgi:hypothetical protein
MRSTYGTRSPWRWTTINCFNENESFGGALNLCSGEQKPDEEIGKLMKNRIFSIIFAQRSEVDPSYLKEGKD